MRILVFGLAVLSFAVLSCSSDAERSRARPFAELAKQCSRDAELGCPHPIFRVTSLRDAQRYYRDALGFKLDWEHGKPPHFASVSRADARLMLSQGSQGKGGAWIVIFARDVDRLHTELKGRGARITLPPTNMPWDMREMHVADPDGNMIRFGSPIKRD